MSEIRWERRGMIRVPVVEDEPTKTLCKVCGSPSPVGVCRPCRDSQRVRVHGSHSGFNQHQRRNELPCLSCSDAERVYQGKRYKRGQLSETDRQWCERNAVAHSWSLDTKCARVASTT